MRLGVDLDDVIADCAVPYLRAFAERFRLEIPEEDLGWQTLAAIEHDLSNGRIESLNTKIQLVTRVAFGFRSPRH